MKSIPGDRKCVRTVTVAFASMALVACASPERSDPAQRTPTPSTERQSTNTQQAATAPPESTEPNAPSKRKVLEAAPPQQGAATARDASEIALLQVAGEPFEPVGLFRGIWDSMEGEQVRVAGKPGWLAAIRSANDPNDPALDAFVFLTEDLVDRLEAKGIMPRLMDGGNPTVRVRLGTSKGALQIVPVLTLELE